MHVAQINDSIVDLNKKRERLLVKRQQIGDTINSIDIEILKLQQEYKKVKQHGLTVTEHAIQRFQERILDLPRQRIKTILSSPELHAKYLRHKSEKYRIKEVPGCVVVIKDSKVITVYSSVDPFYRLMMLEKYMDYYIDCLITKHTSWQQVDVIPFKIFIKQNPVR
jgi:hypothetical protein